MSMLSPATVLCGVSRVGANWIIGRLNSDCGGLEIKAGSRASLVAYYCRKSEQTLHIWGLVVHPRLSGDALWRWLLERIEEGDRSSFTELLGSFALIVYTPTPRRVTIITDAIGSRPLFWRIASDGELILGSDALILKEHRLCGAAVDYDAVATWLMYGYNCTGRSLFGGLSALPPAAVTEFHQGQVHSFSYLDPDYGTAVSQNDLPDCLFELVAESTRAWLQAVPNLTLPLSGGFDSRLLAALYCRERGADTTAYTLRLTHAEATTAKAIAAALGLRWQIVELGSSSWTFDFSPKPTFWERYGGEYQVTADGFPMGKHPIYTLAFDHPGVPVMNGYLGDSLIRGSHDRIEGQQEADFEESELANAIQREYAAQAWVPLKSHLLTPSLAAHIRDRALAPMERIVRESAQQGRASSLTNLRLRQRFYISNNFLQHLDYAESVLPFLSARLIHLKLSNPRLDFSIETYRELFARHVPQISHIPHEREVHRPTRRKLRLNPLLMRWAAQELSNLLARRRLRLLAKRRVAHRLLVGVISPQHEYVLAMVREISLLERFAASLHLPLKWDEL
jgi:asparagine synthetase B (glutamine-hydrolysing)